MKRQRLTSSRCRLGAATVLGSLGRVKGKAGILPALVVALGLGACARPAFVPDGPGAAGPLLHEAPGLAVVVEINAWKARPGALTDAILPLLVVLRNTGTRPVLVARQDFALMDQANRQYLPIHPTEVATMYGGGGPSGVAVSPSVGFGGSSAGGSFFGGGIGLSFGSPGADARDIIPLGLAEGPVQAGAEVRGFLYFPRPAPEIREVRLVAVLHDLPGAPRLEFRFHRSE